MNFLKSVGKALKSKTVWAGIGTAALGTGEILQQYGPVALQLFPATSAIGAGLTIALGAATVYGRVKAKQPLGPVIDQTISDTLHAVHTINGQAPPTPTQIQQVTTAVK